MARAPCAEARAKLAEAKQERTRLGLDDPGGIERVEDAAREARREGCNIDDLVGSGVGQEVDPDETAECGRLRQEWEAAYQEHRAATQEAKASGQYLGTPETRRLNDAMRVARERGEVIGCDPPVYETGG